MKPTKILLIFFLTTCLFSIAQEQLPAWQEGMMDIHHINTGRGDSAFAILPDGTTLLIDAGDMSETRPRTLSARNAELVPIVLKMPWNGLWTTSNNSIRLGRKPF
ncbi:hypothetical protein Q2T40_04890 [Winogradskyella maritima]|nr:hypothetical protein [Winogradskyella maritima]